MKESPTLGLYSSPVRGPHELRGHGESLGIGQPETPARLSDPAASLTSPLLLTVASTAPGMEHRCATGPARPTCLAPATSCHSLPRSQAPATPAAFLFPVRPRSFLSQGLGHTFLPGRLFPHIFHGRLLLFIPVSAKLLPPQRGPP